LSDRHEYAQIPHTIDSWAGGESTFPANQLWFAALSPVVFHHLSGCFV